MPAISSLTRPKIVEATFGDGDETVAVQFDRNRVTLNWVMDVQQAEATQDAGAVAKAISDVIHSWDVVNDDGSPFPPDARNIGSLPSDVLRELTAAIQRAAVPGEAEGKALSAQPNTVSSGYAEPRPTSQNGQVTSTSPELLASASRT